MSANSEINLTMLRELEFKFLIGLINYIDINKEWNNMYKIWLKNEYTYRIDKSIIIKWVSKVNNEKIFYDYINEYPINLKLTCERIARRYW